jgi:RNA recognition motif-containing protein
MSQKLYVGGIAFTTTSEGLRQFFGQSGTVVSASIVTDQFSGQSRGFGFVEMSTPEEAQLAVSAQRPAARRPVVEGGGRQAEGRPVPQQRELALALMHRSPPRD